MGRILVRLFLAAVLLVTTVVSVIAATPPQAVQSETGEVGSHSDDLKHPLGEKRRDLRQKGLEAKLQGAAIENVYEVED